MEILFLLQTISAFCEMKVSRIILIQVLPISLSRLIEQVKISFLQKHSKFEILQVGCFEYCFMQHKQLRLLRLSFRLAERIENVSQVLSLEIIR